MHIVKLGGSLLGRPELPRWLNVITSRADRSALIVPGGGLFADAVRAAQTLVGYRDRVAHHQALLAMQQYGLLLQALQPGLQLVSSAEAIAVANQQGRSMIWSPAEMVLAESSIPANWQATSDSLAAWLALNVGADSLTLVKHLPAEMASASLVDWVQRGILDQAFLSFAQRLTCPLRVVDTSCHAKWGEEKGLAHQQS